MKRSLFAALAVLFSIAGLHNVALRFDPLGKAVVAGQDTDSPVSNSD